MAEEPLRVVRQESQISETTSNNFQNEYKDISENFDISNGVLPILLQKMNYSNDLNEAIEEICNMLDTLSNPAQKLYDRYFSAFVLSEAAIDTDSYLDDIELIINGHPITDVDLYATHNGYGSYIHIDNFFPILAFLKLSFLIPTFRSIKSSYFDLESFILANGGNLILVKSDSFSENTHMNIDLNFIV